MTSHTLILLRHAKAEPLTSGPLASGARTDHDRPLTPRGHRDAAVAGAWLADQSLQPDLVLCSPARRTRQTWHDVAIAMAEAAGGTGARVEYARGLYESTRQDVLDLLAGTTEAVGAVLVIGHNPTLSELSARLDPGHGEALRTCGIAVHDVPGPWAELARTGAPLRLAHTPRAD